MKMRKPEITVEKKDNSYKIGIKCAAEIEADVPRKEEFLDELITSLAGKGISLRTEKGNHDVMWSPVRIGGLEAKNRFAVLPMESADSTPEGTPSADTLKRYRQYTAGGAGIVFIEAACLKKNVREKNQLFLDVKDRGSLKKWEGFFRELKDMSPETLYIFQYQHPGKCSENLEEYIKLQGEAAQFLYNAGCDGVDIKMCHGYLGSRLLREGKGIGFAFKTAEEIRRKVPSEKFLLGARTGNDTGIRETLMMLKGLEERGCSFFGETLGGTDKGHKMMCPETFEMSISHLAMAKIMREALKKDTPLIGAGLSAAGKDFVKVSSHCIENGIFDIAGMGRQAFSDPYLPIKEELGEGAHVKRCTLCGGCLKSLEKREKTFCHTYRR